MPFYRDGIDIESDLAVLSVDEIMRAAQPLLFGRADKRSRIQLQETVSSLTEEGQLRIRRVATQKRAEKEAGHRAKRQKHTDDREASTSLQNGSVDPGFLRAQSEEIIDGCIAKFIDCTGNNALATRVCAVCARSLSVSDTKETDIEHIPNRHLLSPREFHPAHQLIDGLLLESEAIGEGRKCSLCVECETNLAKGRIPRLALANGMWIGTVPFELALLTLPEQVLIARYLPAAFIVKMYPKKKGARSLNSGLRGNVSSYRLDTNEIADMVEGNIMPFPSKILASTIGVTLVGPKNIPEKTMPGFLRVRRNRVRAALVWLKANNPIYADIEISEERLERLDLDGIPVEILATVRFSDQVEELDRERAGYVPDDEDFDHVSYERGVRAGGT